MVKIGTGYINPAHVLAVGPEGTAVRVHLGPGVFVDVTGMTPDEVHAKLFGTAVAEPAPFTEGWADDGGPRWAAQVALNTLADASPGQSIHSHLIALARKALGREGA